MLFCQPGLCVNLPRPVQLPRRRCGHLGWLLRMARVPQLFQQLHEWRQEQRREQLQLSQLKTTAKRSLLYPSNTNIPLYFCMSAPLYIYAILPTYYTMLVCVLHHRQKNRNIFWSEKYFSLFSALREMPRFNFSNICTCSFNLKIANKNIYNNFCERTENIYFV